MAAILADDIFKSIFFNKMIEFRPDFTDFFPWGQNKSALVRAMAWRRTGDKPLPKPMLTQLTDAYMRH